MNYKHNKVGGRTSDDGWISEELQVQIIKSYLNFKQNHSNQKLEYRNSICQSVPTALLAFHSGEKY